MNEKRISPLRWVLQHMLALSLAVLLTFVLFFFLPFMQTIGNPIKRDLDLRQLDTAYQEPPPPPPEIEHEMEEEPPEEPPKLTEEAPPLDLSQLELALNPGFGEAVFSEFSVDLGQHLANGADGGLEAVFSLAELDQRPRVIFQKMPNYPPELRSQNRQGTVYVVFMVDKQGKVVNPKVQKSTDSAFDRYALDAVRQWKFEPGTRRGERVQFKMRVPITYNAS